MGGKWREREEERSEGGEWKWEWDWKWSGGGGGRVRGRGEEEREEVERRGEGEERRGRGEEGESEKGTIGRFTSIDRRSLVRLLSGCFSFRIKCILSAVVSKPLDKLKQRMHQEARGTFFPRPVMQSARTETLRLRLALGVHAHTDDVQFQIGVPGSEMKKGFKGRC